MGTSPQSGGRLASCITAIYPITGNLASELYEDENDCYYELKEIESEYYYQRLDWSPTSWLAPAKYTILWATCGYGVRPHYTLTLGCIIVLLCSLVFYIEPSEASRRTLFSLNTFTTVGYGDWYPTDNRIRLGGISLVHYRTVAMLEGLLGIDRSTRSGLTP